MLEKPLIIDLKIATFFPIFVALVTTLLILSTKTFSDKNARIVLTPRKVRSNSDDNSPTTSCKSFAIGLVLLPSNKPHIKRERTASRDRLNN